MLEEAAGGPSVELFPPKVAFQLFSSVSLVGDTAGGGLAATVAFVPVRK